MLEKRIRKSCHFGARLSLWDSSNTFGDICITPAALLVWKVPVASIQYIDPTLAICIALLSMYFAYRLILAASAILLQATPSTIDTNIIKEAVERLDGVLSAHHVHIFALNVNKLVCSMHVQLLSRETSGNRFMEVMRQVRRILHTYGVHSATIQPEFSLDEADSIQFLKFCDEQNLPKVVHYEIWRRRLAERVFSFLFDDTEATPQPTRSDDRDLEEVLAHDQSSNCGEPFSRRWRQENESWKVAEQYISKSQWHISSVRMDLLRGWKEDGDMCKEIVVI
ncbi:hypothetical protein BFJ70_g8099 [Fusarium oxysporum]|nr:hypothetical protein BFJ70_g8099 [Fusarium oxysporum]